MGHFNSGLLLHGGLLKRGSRAMGVIEMSSKERKCWNCGTDTTVHEDEDSFCPECGVIVEYSTESGRPLLSLQHFNAQMRDRYKVIGQSAPNGIACPSCSSELSDTWPMPILPTLPPTKNIHCNRCGYEGYRLAEIVQMAELFPEERISGKVWTVSKFKGVVLSLTAAVVTAESAHMAKQLLEKELADRGLAQEIPLGEFIPMPTSARKVRILVDGDC